MSRHIWLNKRFTQSTLDQAADVAELVLGTPGVDFPLACRAIGYLMETVRQSGKGHGRHRVVKDPNMSQIGYRATIRGKLVEYVPMTHDRVWTAAIKSGHRYARGINATNYLKAGMALLSAAAKHWGLDVGSPANAVGDKILEKLSESA